VKDLNQTEELFDNLFKESLENASAQVPPGVWEGVSGAVGQGAATTVAGAAAKTALWMKAAIAVLAVSTASYLTYTLVNDNNGDKTVVDSTAQSPVVPNTQNNTQPESNSNPAILNSTYDKAPVSSDPKVRQNNGPMDQGNVNSDAPANLNPNAIYSIDANLQYQPVEKPKPANDVVVKNDKPGADQEKPKSSLPEPTLENNKPEYTFVKDSSYIFIPNAVTPDGDGINDAYQIKLVGEESFEIIIYTTDNQILYRSKNKYQSWNCKMPNGEDAPEGTYLVKVIYKFKGSEQKVDVQKLTLIK
jgi:gliding motility-associated-like protein